MPVWHASVSCQGRPVESWSRDQRRGATRVARELLEGVGVGHIRFEFTDPPGFAIHGQRPLLPQEREGLPSGWMEIPAVDDRGPMIPLISVKVCP